MADILLKDRDGTPVAKEGVDNGINVLLTDGTEKIYVDSDEVPEPVEKTIELDFSGGDMVVEPEEGQAFSVVNIPVPANLIPENIAEGVGISGIIGTMAGGKVVAGNFTPESGTTGAVTIEHGMGVVPDIILVWSQVNSVGHATYGLGVSRAFYDKYVTGNAILNNPSCNLVTASSSNSMFQRVIPPMDELSYSNTESTFSRGVTSVTDKSFSFGNAQYPPRASQYSWIAISGLT